MLLRHGTQQLRQADEVVGRSRERQPTFRVPRKWVLRCPPSTKQHSPERASRGNYGYRNCGSVRLLEFGGSRRNTGPYSACCLRRR